MPRNKKGQIQTQIFVYILSLVLAALLLVFGYQAIAGFSDTQEFVELLTFKIDMKNYIKSIQSSYGDATLETISVPDGYREICFIDNSQDEVVLLPVLTDYPLISDSVETQARQNFFMIDSNTKVTMHAMFIGNISIRNDAGGQDVKYCFNTQNGIMKVRFEALGDRVEITSW